MLGIKGNNGKRENDEIGNFNNWYKNTSYFADIFYNWATPLIRYVNKSKSLDDAHQWIEMRNSDSTENLTNRLVANWKKKEKEGKFNYKWGVVKLIVSTFKYDIFKIVFLGTIAEIINVLNLFATSFIVDWLEEDNPDILIGLLLAISIGLMLLSALIIRHRFFFWGTTTGLNMRKAISGVIFRKLLKFNQKEFSNSSTGKIVTIVSGELQIIESGIILVPYIVIAPMTTVLSFILIGLNFKEAAALGFILYIIIVILQALLSKTTVKWKYLEGLHSDKRIKFLQEAINGIRTIKWYGWEVPIKNLIKRARKNQVVYLIKNHIMNSIGSSFFMNGGYIIALVIFGYHYMLGREFSYSRSLSTISLLSYLSLSSIFFTYSAISNFSSFCAVMFRVGEILKLNEFKPPKRTKKSSLPEGVRIYLKDWSMTWGVQLDESSRIETDATNKMLVQDSKLYEVDEIDDNIKPWELNDINLKIKDGEIVAITGSVGSGKSTLLAGIMQELEIVKGELKTYGSIAYVEQDPFIMSGTVLDNILFGLQFDQNKLDKVIEVWWLDRDISSFSNGLNTDIGERGLTLSGGQKARISLARAVYSEADIYLLDDPLSAVDPSVASDLFHGWINGFLKEKWRVLVTHQIQFLKHVPIMCEIENKRIKIQGSYMHFKRSGKDFDKILKQSTKNLSLFLSKEQEFGPVYKGEPQKIEISMMHSDHGYVESKILERGEAHTDAASTGKKCFVNQQLTLKFRSSFDNIKGGKNERKR